MLLGVKWQTDGGALPIINLLHAGMSLAEKFAFFPREISAEQYIHCAHLGNITKKLLIYNFIFKTEVESFKISLQCLCRTAALNAL